MNNATPQLYSLPPLVSREFYASAAGIELGVFKAQCERGFWPQVHIGKRVLINVEAIRLAAAKKAEQFTL
jgi:hypothetical protein